MSELREKDTGSLHSMEKELTENLFAARLQKRTGQLENTAKIMLTKRELAQVKTVLRARELGLEVIESGAGAKSGDEKKTAKPQAKQAKKSKPVAKKAPAKKGKAPVKAAAPKAKSKAAAAKPAVAKKAEKKTAGKKK